MKLSTIVLIFSFIVLIDVAVTLLIARKSDIQAQIET